MILSQFQCWIKSKNWLKKYSKDCLTSLRFRFKSQHLRCWTSSMKLKWKTWKNGPIRLPLWNFSYQRNLTSFRQTLQSMIPRCLLTTHYSTSKMHKPWISSNLHHLSAEWVVSSSLMMLNRTVFWTRQAHHFAQPAATPSSSLAGKKRRRCCYSKMICLIVPPRKLSWWEWTLPTVYSHSWSNNQKKVPKARKDLINSSRSIKRRLLTRLN
jgi:hypothetical protein